MLSKRLLVDVNITFTAQTDQVVPHASSVASRTVLSIECHRPSAVIKVKLHFPSCWGAVRQVDGHMNWEVGVALPQM